MHNSSIVNMRYFIEKYCKHGGGASVLDVGCQEVEGQENTSYKRLFPRDIHYTGCDMVAGTNVDIILKSPYSWDNIRPGQYQYVVSGQMLEHVEFPWLTFLEIARVLRRGGLCYVIAPSGGPMHNFPLDCYRYYPDGLAALAHYAHFEVVEVFTNYDKNLYPYMDENWKDTVLIARKPSSRLIEWKTNIKRLLLRLASSKSGWSRDSVNPIGF